MGIGTEGSRRVAAAALCASGGVSAYLRLPGPAANGDEGEQLGLPTPLLQDLPVGPGAWVKGSHDGELLIGAGPIVALMASLGFASAQALFAVAAGVVVSDVLYQVTDLRSLHMGGEPCAYRLELSAPAKV